MKTKYNITLIIGGIIFGGSIGTGIVQGTMDIYTAIPIFIFAVLSVGYGFKLRILAKKGIKDTKELKKKN
jgi:hypothetical protein